MSFFDYQVVVSHGKMPAVIQTHLIFAPPQKRKKLKEPEFLSSLC